MEKILKKYFGEDTTICRVKEKPNIPMYLLQRSMYKAEINGISFVIIEIREDEQPGMVAIKKQRAIYEDSFSCNIAFSFTALTRKQRDVLIQNKISFISLPEQIYLPFLGVILSDRFRNVKEIKTEKMTPATQQLFLYLLYQKRDAVLKSEAAAALRITRTSITRASEQLLAMDLIEQVRCGKEIRMKLKYSAREAVEKAFSYMINPVQEKITVEKSDFTEKYLYAGETALGQYSMLNPPNVATVAVYKGNIDKKELNATSIRLLDLDSVITIELWKYNPMLFSFFDKVDPVSLACSLKDNEDERVEMAIEEMMEEYVW